MHDKNRRDQIGAELRLLKHCREDHEARERRESKDFDKDRDKQKKDDADGVHSSVYGGKSRSAEEERVGGWGTMFFQLEYTFDPVKRWLWVF